MENIPWYFWAVLFGVIGQSLSAFWIMIVLKAEEVPPLQRFLPQAIVAALLHAVAVLLVIAAITNVNFIWVLVAIGVAYVSQYPMRDARDQFL